MRLRLRDEAEHCYDRPRENPRLPPWQCSDNLAPHVDSRIHVFWAVKEIIQTMRERPRTTRRFDRVAKSHLLK